MNKDIEKLTQSQLVEILYGRIKYPLELREQCEERLEQICNHEFKEYQAEETDTNIPERLFCVDCDKDFNVQDEQEVMLENERE